MKYLCLILLLSACAAANVNPGTTKSEPPLAGSESPKPNAAPKDTPAEQPASSLLPASCPDHTWCYDQVVKSRLTPTMLNAQPGKLCPKYQTVDRAKFWLTYVAAIALAENNWKDKGVYIETTMGKDPITGKQIASEGQLQLSYQDVARYPEAATCQLINYPARNLQSGPINVGCGVEIMHILLGRFGPDMYATLGRYWSTARVIKPKYDKDGKRVVSGPEKVATYLKKKMPECGT